MTRDNRKTITVAHIVLSLDVGGLERVIVNLVRGQQARYRVMVICLEHPGVLLQEITQCGAESFVLNKKIGIHGRVILKLARLLAREKVTIVHTHNPVAHLHGVLAGRLAGTPVIVHTKHGRNSPHKPKLVRMNRYLSKLTHAVVPVSDDSAKVVLEVEKVNPKKVRRVWNGVDVSLYRPSPGTDKLVVGTVARLSFEKDQDTLLKAFRVVLDQMPEARLMIVGDGPYREELTRTAVDLKMTGNVDFLGMRADVETLLPQMSLFTLSSITEGISMTILEAMACGLPIVATDVGGNREIIQPPLCGLMVPAKNPQALGEAYLELLRDPERRARMGAAARQRVIEHFSLDSMVREYSALYEEFLKK